MDTRPWHAFYDEGIPKIFPFIERTLVEALDHAAAQRPDNTAIWFLNKRISYRELKDQVDRLATALARLGVVKGTRVAIQLPNLPQSVIAYYAVLAAGGQVVMTNPLYVAREIEYQWFDANCEVAIVADFVYEHRIKPIRARLPVKQYIVASIPEYLGFPLNLLAPLKLKRMKPPTYAKVRPEPRVHLFKALVEATPPTPPKVPVGLDDIAVLQYTGGTTGIAKAAALTHRNLSVNAQGVLAWLHIADFADEVILSALPFFHVFGMTICMNFPVYAACAMVILPNPRDIPAIVQAVAKRRVTLFMGVPAMFAAINNFPGIDKIDISSVTSCFSGSAPLPVDVLQKFEGLTGSRIVEGFGLTETSPVTHCNPMRTVRKVGSIGVPFVETDCRIVDIETRTRDLPPGQDGELVIKGPQVMNGYWNRPEESALVLKDGWLFTGDIARMDEDGYFFISGRIKDMIIVSGYNVYPDEVDGVLMAHPAVLEAATIGVPDVKRGEIVKSFLVLKPGMTATAEEITAYCRENLAAYKVPRALEFRSELPKNPVLKILRRELRDQEMKKMHG
ncbi:MAG: long-chain fatty acid--CoA ligase [Gemmatimonadales bacterium]|jgi:long-chain acyl-CoA synthetase